ncbi:serine protease [Flavobacterium sp. RHBU_3]|uniref:S1 family peptidase n=1 Tax=Flavobacterium sp. RHBU_3 TaxID=3391184 RepID=UPI0039850E12
MYSEEIKYILPHLSPTELLKFFNLEPANRALKGKNIKPGESVPFVPLSLSDYLATIPRNYLYDKKYINLYHNTALMIANKLVLEGLLSPVGERYGIEQQYKGNSYNAEKAHHNCYDFFIYGFPEVVDHFRDAVRLIEVKEKESCDINIGTGFAILYKHKKQYFITAKHCLPKKSEIRIKIFLGHGLEYESPENIYVHQDDNIDVAILEFSDRKLVSDKFFRLEHPYILDNILVMGYPPIPGTSDAVLVSSTGEITAKANTYFHKYEQIYVNANIKGGSSGSPIINTYGNVVGIVIESARDIKNNELQDELRFGTGLTSNLIQEIIESVNVSGSNHKILNFKTISNGSFEIV